MIYISFTPYFPSSTSVIGPFVYDQVRAIERTKRFERVIVLKPFPWYARNLCYTYGGETVYGVRAFQLPSKILPDLFNGLNRWFFFRRLRQLGISNHERHEQMILHIHTSPLAKYGVWIKEHFPACQTWLQHHDLDPMLVRMGRLRNWRWHQRMAVRTRARNASQMDLQICVSQLALRQLRAFPKNTHTSYPDYDHALLFVNDFPPINVHSAYVLYNGVDTSVFTPAQQPVPHACFTIGCVAGFYEWKGQLTLIKAIERVVAADTLCPEKKRSEVRLILVGEGLEKEKCETYVREHHLGQAVRFEGVRNHEELVHFYRSLDLFVLPSTFETFACVYFEAAACGVPYICCKGQGNAESIFPEDAELWLAEPDDDAQLAGLITKFMKARPPQRLAIPISMNILVPRFLDCVLKEP